MKAFSNPSNDKSYFCPKHKDAKISENHLNPVMLVLIGELFLCTLRCAMVFLA